MQTSSQFFSIFIQRFQQYTMIKNEVITLFFTFNTKNIHKVLSSHRLSFLVLSSEILHLHDKHIQCKRLMEIVTFDYPTIVLLMNILNF
jgi:hypothetical protein